MAHIFSSSQTSRQVHYRAIAKDREHLILTGQLCSDQSQ